MALAALQLWLVAVMDMTMKYGVLAADSCREEPLLGGKVENLDVAYSGTYQA